MKVPRYRYVYSLGPHKNEVMEFLLHSFPILRQAQQSSVIYMVSFGEFTF